MKRNFKWIIVLIILLSFVGCTKETAVSNKKITVGVSIVPQETFVKAVGGDLVEVVTMIPPGNSPANYLPSPKEFEALSNASIYFSIGVPTEKGNILSKVNEINKNMKVVSLNEEVAKVYKDREFTPDNRDPHIWLSPKRTKVMIETIKVKLCEIDPSNKSIYKKNATKYLEQIDQTDKKIKDSLKDLPKKSFIVYHPAFGYFADDYGLKMIAIEKEGKEATIDDIKEIIDYAKKENIKVVFCQQEMDVKQSQIIAEEIGGKTEMIEPLSEDYIKNLQKMADAFYEALK